MEFRVRVCQVVNLESADRVVHILDTREEHGNYDKGLAVGRYAVFQVQLWKDRRWDDERNHVIDDADREVAQRDERDERDNEKFERRRARTRRVEERQRDHGGRNRGDSAEVHERRVFRQDPCCPCPEHCLVPCGGFENGDPIADKVVSDVSSTHVVRVALSRNIGELDGKSCNVGLVVGRAPGNSLDRVPVSVPRRKVEAFVRAGRVTTQHHVHRADTLEKLRPVRCRDGPHRRDRVANRYLIRSLARAFTAEDVVDGCLLLGQTALQPVNCRIEGCFLVSEPLEHFGDEHRRRRRNPLCDARRHDCPDSVGALLGDCDQFVNELVCGFDLLPSLIVAGGESRKVLDETEPHCNRDGPQFADRER